MPWRAATCNNVFFRSEARLARPVMTCIIRIACDYLWHDVNKVLTENTPLAYLTGEACLAPTCLIVIAVVLFVLCVLNFSSVVLVTIDNEIVF